MRGRDSGLAGAGLPGPIALDGPLWRTRRDGWLWPVTAAHSRWPDVRYPSEADAASV